MEAEIGNAAGVIWRYLEQHGETSLTDLKLKTKVSDKLFFMGVGWLTKEGKLNFVTDKRSTRVSLRRL